MLSEIKTHTCSGSRCSLFILCKLDWFLICLIDFAYPHILISLISRFVLCCYIRPPFQTLKQVSQEILQIYLKILVHEKDYLRLVYEIVLAEPDP